MVLWCFSLFVSTFLKITYFTSLNMSKKSQLLYVITYFYYKREFGLNANFQCCFL